MLSNHSSLLKAKQDLLRDQRAEMDQLRNPHGFGRFVYNMS